MASANLNIMINAARKAGRSLVKDFREVENLQVSVKGAGDFVSRADREAERIIKEELRTARPNYGWIGEETGEDAGEDPTRRWIVDPLDGTTNFLHGLPHWAVSIALEHKGEIVAAVIFGLLGNRVRERDSVIGVVMAFGLGLAVLFIALNPGRIGTGFNLLAGQAINAGTQGAEAVVITTVVVVAAMAVIYRPLLFASTDPRVAEARGVPMRLLSVVFAVLLGAAVAQSVQIIGALLVMSLLITPAAAAMRVSSNPTVVLGLSILFAEIAAVGGIVLAAVGHDDDLDRPGVVLGQQIVEAAVDIGRFVMGGDDDGARGHLYSINPARRPARRFR